MQGTNSRRKITITILRWSSHLPKSLAGFRKQKCNHYTTVLSNIIAVITLHISSFHIQHNLLPNFICHVIREIYFLKVLDGVRCISLHNNLVCRSECFYFLFGPAKIPTSSVTHFNQVNIMS
jgi:hypothetical protein